MQSRNGVTWITESTAAAFENFLRTPVGENEYKNPSNEPIDIQPVKAYEVAENANKLTGNYEQPQKFIQNKELPVESTPGV